MSNSTATDRCCAKCGVDIDTDQESEYCEHCDIEDTDVKCRKCGSTNFTRTMYGFERRVPCMFNKRKGAVIADWDRSEYSPTPGRFGCSGGFMEDKYVCAECGEDVPASAWDGIEEVL